MHTRGEADPREFVLAIERSGSGIRALAPAIGETIEIPETASAS
jgi:hypothetical protein